MTNEELQQLVCEISAQDFAQPFLHQAVFNKRLRTTGGRYLLQSHNIEVNPKYFEQFGLNEVIAIIKHELCHYHLHLAGKGYKHGDKDFKALLKQTNSPRYCQPLTHTTKVPSFNYHYSCTDCGQLYPRKRKINTAKYRCSKCSGEIKLKNEKGVDVCK